MSLYPLFQLTAAECLVAFYGMLGNDVRKYVLSPHAGTFDICYGLQDRFHLTLEVVIVQLLLPSE